jgi:hypothetical protein
MGTCVSARKAKKEVATLSSAAFAGDTATLSKTQSIGGQKERVTMRSVGLDLGQNRPPLALRSPLQLSDFDVLLLNTRGVRGAAASGRLGDEERKGEGYDSHGKFHLDQVFWG